LVGVVLAQTPDPDRRTPRSSSSTQSTDRDTQTPAQSADRDAQAPAQTTDKTTQPTPEKSPGSTEVKTQNYKGTLVDATCAGSGGSPSAKAQTGSATAETNAATNSASADRTSKDRASSDSTASADTGKSKSSGGDQGQACSASSSTTQFALKTKEGRTLAFDEVGNQRAQQTLKEKKKWSEASSAGKPIQAKVSGVVEGDKLTVMSIN